MSPALLFLVACQSTEPEPKASTDTAAPPAGDSGAYEDWSHLLSEDPHSPQLSADEVGAQIESVFARGFPRPQDVVVNFFNLMTQADEDCPGSSGFANGFENLEGCLTENGHFFQGAAGVLLYDERDFTSDTAWTGTFDLMSQPADYSIYRPDGTSMQGAGIFLVGISRTESSITFRSSLNGYFSDETSTGWLGREYSGRLDIRGEGATALTRYRMTGYLEVDGAAIQLDTLSVDTELSPDQPVSGTVSLRQSDATWYSLVLDEDGSGCGALTWEGSTDLGTLCVDLSPVVEVAPNLMVY